MALFVATICAGVVCVVCLVWYAVRIVRTDAWHTHDTVAPAPPDDETPIGP